MSREAVRWAVPVVCACAMLIGVGPLDYGVAFAQQGDLPAGCPEDLEEQVARVLVMRDGGDPSGVRADLDGELRFDLALVINDFLTRLPRLRKEAELPRRVRRLTARKVRSLRDSGRVVPAVCDIVTFMHAYYVRLLRERNSGPTRSILASASRPVGSSSDARPRPRGVAASATAERAPRAALDAQRAAEQRAAEQRAAEQREAERRMAEKRAAEQRAAEQRAAQRRAAEQRAAERRAAEQRAAEQREAERRLAERRAAERRAAEQRAAEKREAERREAERRAAERRAAERRAFEQAVAAQKAAAEAAIRELAQAQRAAEQRVEEKRAAAERATQRMVAAQRAAAQKAIQELAAEQEAAEKRVAERKAAEERAAAEKRAAEQRAAEERAAAEKRAAEQRAAEERAAAEKRVAEQKAAAERAAAEKRAAEQKAAEERVAAEQKAAEQRAAEQELAEERAEQGGDAAPSSEPAVAMLRPNLPRVPGPKPASPALLEDSGSGPQPGPSEPRDATQQVMQRIESLLSVPPYLTLGDLRRRNLVLTDSELGERRRTALSARDELLEVLAALRMDPARWEAVHRTLGPEGVDRVSAGIERAFADSRAEEQRAEALRLWQDEAVIGR